MVYDLFNVYEEFCLIWSGCLKILVGMDTWAVDLSLHLFGLLDSFFGCMFGISTGWSTDLGFPSVLFLELSSRGSLHIYIYMCPMNINEYKDY